ncbi:hypothetical protein C8R43DRAFT_1240216 [Mycena crocata]|nr:hypothetical protein C8R43DRAFT_1240216 [Mycena crocata]
MTSRAAVIIAPSGRHESGISRVPSSSFVGFRKGSYIHFFVRLLQPESTLDPGAESAVLYTCSDSNCKKVSSTLSPPPSPTHPLALTTSPISSTHVVISTDPPQAGPSSHSVRSLLEARASDTGKLLGAELGGSLGGAALLLLLFIVFVCLRRRRARELASRLPTRQEPFIINPTWILPSPTSPQSGTASASHLSLPDHARPRNVPAAALPQQMSMPNLAAQYRSTTRLVPLRPRASTVGTGPGGALARTEPAGSTLVRTETAGSREQTTGSDVGSRGESSINVWRPRIDILGARHHRPRTEGGDSGIPMQSFWAE